MKAIIGERPNIKPVGIGNSASAIDLNVLEPDVRDEGSEPEDTENAAVSERDNEVQGESQRHANKNKRSSSAAELDEDIKPKLGTPARQNTSKPTATGSKPKKVKGFEDIAGIAIAEEVSRQKELELDAQRSKDKASRVLAKAEVKKAAIEAKKERERQAHEMEMMKMQLELAKFQRTSVPGVGVQPIQGDINLPGLCPPFTPNLPFGNDG